MFLNRSDFLSVCCYSVSSPKHTPILPRAALVAEHAVFWLHQNASSLRARAPQILEIENLFGTGTKMFSDTQSKKLGVQKGVGWNLGTLPSPDVHGLVPLSYGSFSCVNKENLCIYIWCAYTKLAPFTCDILLVSIGGRALRLLTCRSGSFIVVAAPYCINTRFIASCW